MGSIIRRLHLLPAVLLLSALAAQIPARVTLVPTYTAGERLYYSVSIHTDINTTVNQGAPSHSTLTTEAEIELHILPGAQPGNFQAEMRFTRYHTTAQSADPSTQAQLQQKMAQDDADAAGMTPARFQVAHGQFSILARQPGGQYDQAVDMLSEMVRTEDLPTGPVSVGAQWTRARSRQLPGMNASLPLTLHCSLTALGSAQGQPTATIAVHAEGQADLPPTALPGADALARQGFVPIGKLSSNTTATSQFRAADAVLLASASETHSQVSIQLIGPTPQPQTTDSLIHSTGTVKLERVTAAAN